MAGKKGKKKAAAAAKKSGATTPIEEASRAPSDAGDEPIMQGNDTAASIDTIQDVPNQQNATGDAAAAVESATALVEQVLAPVDEAISQETQPTQNESTSDDVPAPETINVEQQPTHATDTNGTTVPTPSPDAALREALDAQTSRADRLQQEKTTAEAQYRNLLSKVTQMKATLGARIKEDAEELAQNKVQIEELAQQNVALTETVAQLQEQAESSASSNAEHDASLAKLREAVETERRQREQAETALSDAHKAYEGAKERQSMQISDWETIALEERAARDHLRERISELEEQVAMSNQGYESLRNVAEQDAAAIQAYKKTIYEMQTDHKDALREAVEAMQATIDGLADEKQTLVTLTNQLQAQTGTLQDEIAKLRPHENEVKEKTLLIGKLRHEAVILNEHLTKALRLLKRGSSNDAVDRQLLSNLLISFLNIPRQDSKRFEVLKLLASVLSWSDEQKEAAGLLRPGSTTGNANMVTSPSSARTPAMSPSAAFPGGTRPGFFSSSRRSSSTTAQLQAADFIGRDNASMSELWINFLERSSEVEPAATAASSRATSPGAARVRADSPSPAQASTAADLTS